MTPLRTIAVLGAGTMGHGIAHVAAQAGYTVYLRDIEHAYVEKGLAGIRKNLDKGVEKGKVAPADRDATLARIIGTTDLSQAVRDADLVIEAVPEKLDLKRKIFHDVDHLAPAHAILATNTSSISVSEIARATHRPHQVVGMHFFNPPHLMKLLEIVRGQETTETTLAVAREVGAKMGKETILVKDTPGFATSRLGVALGLEAIRMLEEGVASAEDIDKAMVLGYNHPMGPLRLTDLVGLDVRLNIADYLSREVGPQFNPPALLRTMVKEGKLGQKSGQGFYQWTG
ncbi:MAG TPA: 3-hydroxyacyl-CoA dehydrogenase family protein [Candidatus Thermoplasmatota archaeon]|nr:3-hydroxyacyl-CoA dehydrogenase family protein [Candidatus Thermoplasmatota archaeon]